MSGSCWHECKNAKNIQNVQKARGLSPYLCPMPEILGAALLLSASADDLIILDVRSPANMRIPIFRVPCPFLFF